MDLRVSIVEIRGKCPVYQAGNSFLLKSGYVLDTKRSSPVCMHSLASILPYYVALSRGVEPEMLGLSPSRGKHARVQCLDPCEYTEGGTVVLEITRVENT